jgi:hypothetical protein
LTFCDIATSHGEKRTNSETRITAGGNRKHRTPFQKEFQTPLINRLIKR